MIVQERDKAPDVSTKKIALLTDVLSMVDEQTLDR